jgi:hypothetical protein
MALDSLRQKPLSAALPAASQGGAPAFGPHTRAKPMLAFASSLRWLVSAFHKAEKSARRELRAVSLGWSGGLSMKPEEVVDPHSVGSEHVLESRVASAHDFCD